MPAPREELVSLAVADFLLRLAEVQLEAGAATADIEASVIAAGSALGVPHVEVDITFSAVTVTVPRENDLPITRVRVVWGRSPDYSRLAAAHNLVVDLLDRQLDRDQALVRLGEIEAQRSPYPRWLITVAWGTLAAAVTLLLGGSLSAAGTAFVTTAMVDRLGRILARRSWPDFFLNVVGALCATLVAVALVTLDVPIQPSYVVAGGITVLLSGVAFVTTMHDAITGFLVTAAGRAVEVLLLSAGIISGVAIGLLLARRFGVSMAVLPPPQTPMLDFPLRAAAAGFGAAAFAVANRAPRRLIPPAAALGALGYAVFVGLMGLLLQASAAAVGAAAVVGLAGHVLAVRRRAYPLGLVVPAIVPLLPGLTIYRGMLLLTDGASTEGLLVLLEAATTALALAAGVILGEIAGRPTRRELARVERRLTRRGRRRSGPPGRGSETGR